MVLDDKPSPEPPVDGAHLRREQCAKCDAVTRQGIEEIYQDFDRRVPLSWRCLDCDTLIKDAVAIAQYPVGAGVESNYEQRASA